jgi:hypothetical protein
MLSGVTRNSARRLQRSEGERPSLPILDPDRLELTLIKVGRVDVERQDVAGMRGT